MYGINAGYDTRPMSTGPADTGIPVYASRTAFFQQAAVNAEAVSEKWRVNAYGLIPVGEDDYQLNSATKVAHSQPLALMRATTSPATSQHLLAAITKMAI